jgi:chromate transporter
MNWLTNPALQPADWLDLFLHFLLLSMLSIGGAIAVAPEMHRYVVRERGWLSDIGFTDSVALAQAAPGPNILFVAVIGWNVAGLTGMAVTMLGILLPSTTLALAAARYGRQHAHSPAVRAFTAGMAPLTIGLMLATGWVLTDPSRGSPVALAIVLGTVVAMLRTKASPLWLIGTGALIGALGWI